MSNKNTERIFIKETLGTRNYFSYRSDLILYKIMLSIFAFFSVFLITEDWKFSVLISAEVFAIFTLINKLNIERKKNEGEKKLISKMQKEHFKKKINEINIDDFKMLITFFLEKKGYRNFLRRGRHMLLAEKNGLINCIKIYKFYDDIELEKIDLRNLVTFMCQSNIKAGYIVTTGNLNEEAKKFIDGFKDELNIKVVDFDGLFDIIKEHEMLPNNEYFYGKAEERKDHNKKKIDIIVNVFDNKKIFVYILSAVFFYVSSLVMPENNVSRYISYYFIILTIISIVHMVWMNKFGKAKNL